MREAAFVLDFGVDLYLAPRKDDAHSLSLFASCITIFQTNCNFRSIASVLFCKSTNLRWGGGILKYKSSRVSSFHAIMVDGDEQSGVH